MDYGCHVYDTSSTSLLNKLDSIQCNCLRICTGAMRTTPLNVLQVDCLEMPLHLRRQLLQLQYCNKVSSILNPPSSSILKPDWRGDCPPNRPNGIAQKRTTPERIPLYLKVETFLNSLTSTIFNSLLVNPIPYWFLLKPSIDISLTFNINKKLSPVVIKHYALEFISKWDNYLHIYTDASRVDYKSGPAFYVPFFNIFRQLRLPDNISVYSAELFAILASLL
jgi:hypothetical protein